MSGDGAEKSEPILTQASGYLRGSIDELKKVSHPTRQEAMQATLATLFIIVVVSLCLFVLDLVFGKVMTAILS